MVVMTEMTDEKNIEQQLRTATPGIFSVSVLDVNSLPKLLTWSQDGVNYRAYLLAPQYRIEQLNKTT
jgi:hypothetical protein